MTVRDRETNASIAASARYELEVGAMVGEYKIQGLVGEGGMGQVYGALHPIIGKRAAVKVLRLELCADLDAIDRFVLEARSVNQIGHPNIVDIFAFGVLPDQRQYLVMEWLRGESLLARLARGPLSIAETCNVVLALCAALGAAHEHQIIHRDLKPHNVFLADVRGAAPIVKLLDFGLAKLLGPDDQRMERTRTGSLLGTPAYMSPEQARGIAIDHHTDLYSLGVMTFQLLTGQLPFHGETAMDLVVAHMQAIPPPPSSLRPEIPHALDDIIVRLMAKRGLDRPSLDQVADVAREIVASTVVRASSQPSTSSSPSIPAFSPAFSPPSSSSPPIPAFSTAPAPSSPSFSPPAAPSFAAPGTTTELVHRRRWGFVVLGIGVVIAGALAFAIVFATSRDQHDGQSPSDAGATSITPLTDAAPPTRSTPTQPDAATAVPVTLDAASPADAAYPTDASVAKPERPRDAGRRARDAAVPTVQVPIDAGSPAVLPPVDAAAKARPSGDDGDDILRGGSGR